MTLVGAAPALHPPAAPLPHETDIHFIPLTITTFFIRRRRFSYFSISASLSIHLEASVCVFFIVFHEPRVTVADFERENSVINFVLKFSHHLLT